MNKQYTLVEATLLIQLYHGRELTKIEFEDGSRRSFNYQLAGDPRTRFIRMDTIEPHRPWA